VLKHDAMGLDCCPTAHSPFVPANAGTKSWIRACVGMNGVSGSDSTSSRPALATKLKAAVVAAALAGALAADVLSAADGSDIRMLRRDPAVVDLQPGTIRYRAAGDFTRGGKPVEAPISTIQIKQLAIMRHQVTASDYQECVAAAACQPLAANASTSDELPVVRASWRDAEAYAAWLSRNSGHRYRLPTDQEWAFAAGSRYRDDVLAIDATNPARRWLARYERDSARSEIAIDAEPRPIGSFGANENGLLDLAGNVWEWTSTCFERVALDDSGTGVLAKTVNCGVRVVEGEHRAYVTDFIRDARAGGCATGVPPSNLRFRLVREPDPRGRLRQLLAKVGLGGEMALRPR
jgi:formylglycine-generating enzyme required for sulfatase activity